MEELEEYVRGLETHNQQRMDYLIALSPVDVFQIRILLYDKASSSTGM
jgi:hypothetical protein